MDGSFITWSMLYEWVSFVAIVFMVTQFIKNKGFLKKIDTRDIAFCVSLVLLVVSNLVAGSFKLVDMVIYLLTSILVTTQSSGIYDSGKVKETTSVTEAKK